MWPPLVTAFNLLDGFHATFLLASSTHVLIWEGLLAMPPVIAPLSTREIQASHGHPADEPVGNLQVYWLRVAASFQTPIGLLEAAGLAGLLSPTQRAVVLSMLALHHFFDGIAIHGGQVSTPTLAVTGNDPRNSTWHAENCPLFWPKPLLCDLSLTVPRRVWAHVVSYVPIAFSQVLRPRPGNGFINAQQHRSAALVHVAIAAILGARAATLW
eukprot:m.42921 g.42921  ORF g.42921 m.42921 type:complete len:213 (-) comp8372_c0_seq1:117-755(-)